MEHSKQNLSPRAEAKVALDAGLYAASSFLSDIIHDAGTNVELKLRAIKLALEVHQHLLALEDMPDALDSVGLAAHTFQSGDEQGAETF